LKGTIHYHPKGGANRVVQNRGTHQADAAGMEGDWRDRYEWPTEDTWVVDITRWVVNTFLRVACELNVMGLERVPPTGPLIVAANHVHTFDSFLLGAVIPRKIMVVANAGLYAFRPVGWFLRMCGTVPVEMGRADQWSLNRSLQILKQGKVLCIYPEGSCQRHNGMITAKTGVAFLACKSGAPILPVAITGTESLLHWRRIRGRMKMGLRVGSVLEVDRVSEPSPDQLRLITDELMFRIASMLPLSYQGVYRL